MARARVDAATIRFSDLTGLTIRECDVDRLETDSHDLFFGSLNVNGVDDVVPLVGGEGSLHQTLRHVILATDGWLHGGIERQEQPFHPIGLPFTGDLQMGHDAPVLREPENSDVIMEVRAAHQHEVADYLGRLTQEELDEPRDHPWGPADDWKPTVGDCIRAILEEEWAHVRYVRRDLEALRAGRT